MILVSIYIYISLSSIMRFTGHRSSYIGPSTPFHRINKATDGKIFIVNLKPLFRSRSFLGTLIYKDNSLLKFLLIFYRT